MGVARETVQVQLCEEKARRRSEDAKKLPEAPERAFSRILGTMFYMNQRQLVSSVYLSPPCMVGMGRNLISKNTGGFWTKLDRQVPPPEQGSTH